MVFQIGGVSVEALDRQFGAPLYAYDQEQIVKKC